MSVYEVNSNNELILNNSDSFIGNINPYRYKDYYFGNESKLYCLNSRHYSWLIRKYKMINKSIISTKKCVFKRMIKIFCAT